MVSMMPDIDAKILGKIILLQSTIHLMQEEDALARFAARGFSAIPGVQAAGMVFNGTFYSEIADPDVDAGICRTLFDAVSDRVRNGESPDLPLADFREAHHLECMAIQTVFDLYGLLFLKLSDPDRFLGYRPYIENTVNLIALIVENNHRRDLLLKSNEVLERAVEERTRELRASEAQYKTLFESIRDIILVADLDRNIISANQAFTEVFGYSLEEVLGRRTRMLYADHAQFDRLGGKLERAGRDPLLLMTIDYLKKSGETFPGETRIFGFKDTEGKTVGIMGIIRDVSDRIRAEEEKARLEAQLHQARKMEAIGTLSGGIAHDFNNILAIIIGNAELAQDDIPEGSSAHRFITEVVKGGLRARDVVRQLLTFSRKSRERKKPLVLSPIVKEALKLMRSTLPATIDIRQSIPDRLPAVEADATQIHQIMINLCSNAADAMAEEGGELDVRLEPVVLEAAEAAFDSDILPGDYVRLTVADTGDGISTGDAERIFEPYFTTKPVDKGTGMGLAVVHGIVKGHGGGIRMRRRNGRGVAFEVFLPALERPAETEAASGGSVVGGTERILFVDDEPAIAQMNRWRLEKLGYRVEIATDPVAALARFRSAPEGFDLVVTDMTMPKMTGDRLTRELLKIRPDLPVMLCTGYSDRISRETAAAYGIRKFVEKPVDVRDLAVFIREVLDAPPTWG
jgi:PAS domain S-box-containing protein